MVSLSNGNGSRSFCCYIILPSMFRPPNCMDQEPLDALPSRNPLPPPCVFAMTIANPHSLFMCHVELFSTRNFRNLFVEHWLRFCQREQRGKGEDGLLRGEFVFFNMHFSHLPSPFTLLHSHSHSCGAGKMRFFILLFLCIFFLFFVLICFFFFWTQHSDGIFVA